MIKEFICDKSNIRVDFWLSQRLEDISRSYIKKISEKGGLKVNQRIVKPSFILKQGDSIAIDIQPPKPLDVIAQKIDVQVLYEDDDILIVNKPKGMVVHPACGNSDGTLVNALLGMYGDNLSNINGVIRPGIVHRIDKDTSGVLVVARNNKAHESLSNLFKTHDINREYVALVEGRLDVDKAKIDAPIGRHPKDRKKMSVNTKNGKDAITHFEVLERFKDKTLILAKLETGRTHQIRVHMAYIGHPLVSDPVYGNKKGQGQVLHARLLGFKHPTTNIYVEFTASLPQEFEKLLHALRT